MDFIIDPLIFEQFPNTLLGVIVLQNIDNKGDYPDITQLLRQSEQKAINKLDNSLIIEHPHILPWRAVYKKFGAKPKEYPSSIENLLRRVLKGEQIRHINTLVDIYNIISLKYFLPVGGEDLAKITGNVELTIATNNEPVALLLGEKEARPPHPGEVIYKDEISAICRRWNWKEAERTKLTKNTEEAFMVIEGLPPVNKDLMQLALTNFIELIKKYCGGEIKSSVLDSSNNRINLL
jgi:lysyl-tRNA synthetase class 2